MRTDREVAVFIRRGDRFLVMHRALDRYWHVVAGVVETGETFAAAARRELREETGLDAEVTDLEMPQSYAVPTEMSAEYGSGVEAVAVQNFGIVVPGDWEPVLNEEHDDYRWLGLADAIAIVRWPETMEIIATLARPALETSGPGSAER